VNLDGEPAQRLAGAAAHRLCSFFMAGNRIMQGGAVRRATLGAVAILAAASLLAGCGGEQDTTAAAAAEQQADAALLNTVLARQRAVVDAYDTVLPGLRGRRLAIARRFRAQEQEHADAVVEEMLELGIDSEPAPEAVAPRPLGDEEDRLAYLAELEGRTIEMEIGAIYALTESRPRATLTSIVANQAQHLVLLRRALGATPQQSIPSAFENGTEPLP
jgi:hypothetical protein